MKTIEKLVSWGNSRVGVKVKCLKQYRESKNRIGFDGPGWVGHLRRTCVVATI